MTPLQKEAWLTVMLFSGCLLLYLLLIPLLGPAPALGIFGLFGFAGLSGGFYHRAKRRGEPTMDERDRQIAQQATLGGYSLFWVGFVLACMLTWGLSRRAGRQTVPIDVLPWLVFGGMLLMWTTRAVIILVLYRRQVPHETH